MDDVDSHCPVTLQREFVLINFTGTYWIHSQCQVEGGKGQRMGGEGH